MNNMFKEKVAVVTGGASGIGLATTKKIIKWRCKCNNSWFKNGWKNY